MSAAPQHPQSPGRGIAQIFADYRTRKAAYAPRPEEKRGTWAEEGVILLEVDEIRSLEREAMACSATTSSDAIAALAWICEAVLKEPEIVDHDFIVSMAGKAMVIAIANHDRNRDRDAVERDSTV